MQEEYSVAVWVKPLGNHYHYNGVIFSSGDWNKTARYSFGLSQDNSQVDILCKGYNNYLTCAVPINTWTHLICTCDSNNIVRLYKNGEYINSSARNDKPDSDNANQAAIGRETYANGYFTFNGMLNDFRLYDHCLSPMEIKQISKGLILHYPLSDKYLESTANMITSEDSLSATCYNGVLGKYGYGSNTDMYKEVAYFEGRKGTKVYNKTNGTAMFPYIYINNMYTSDGTNSPPYKTLSFDYYTTISTSISPYKLGNGNGTATYIVRNSSGVETGTGVNSVVIPVVPNTWNHIEVTFHGTTAADSQWGYIINSPSHASNTDNFWFFANMQLEIKDHATGYAGVGGTRNSTTVYDTSGFCNNGIAFGTFTVSNNTPKYNVSTVFNGTDNAIQTPSLPSMISDKNYTIAVWIYKTVIGSKSYQTIYGGPSGFEIEARNGGANETKFVPWNWGKPMASYELNEWNHCVFVHSDSDCKIYLNGEYIATGTAKAANPSGNYFVGAWNTATQQNFDGLMSDFRIYATALSAEDIKSLYNNSAYIDSQGNIYGAVYEEV